MDISCLFWTVIFAIITRSAIAYEYWWRHVLTDRYRFSRRGSYSKYLIQNPTHQKFINKGINHAVKECKRLFKYNRWNCESGYPKKPFGDVVDIGCRETAFVYAITSAGLTYEMIRACSEGKIAGCRKTCMRPEDVNFKQTRLLNATHTLNEACDDNLRFGYKAWNNFVFKGERSSDIRATFNIRNSIVGLKQIKKSAKLVCRCHGVSGSCMLQICSEKVASNFELIGEEIHKMYQNAKYDIPDQRIIESQAKNIIRYRKTSTSEVNRITHVYNPQQRSVNNVRRKRSEMFNVENLEFFEHSPDFCYKSQYAIGTENRICKPKVTLMEYRNGAKTCDEICCRGRGLRKVKRLVTSNCKFHYCCKVTCNEDWKMVRQNYCL